MDGGRAVECSSGVITAGADVTNITGWQGQSCQPPAMRLPFPRGRPANCVLGYFKSHPVLRSAAAPQPGHRSAVSGRFQAIWGSSLYGVYCLTIYASFEVYRLLIDRDQILNGLKNPFADTAHVHDFGNIFEVAVFFAVLYDIFGADRTDSGESFQFSSGGPVYVD